MKRTIFLLCCLATLTILRGQNCAEYSGDKIVLNNNICLVCRMGEAEGVVPNYQGMDIWNGKIVSLEDSGMVSIYNYNDNGVKKVGKTFPLATNNALNHANVASFTNIFADKTDKLPLLCISRCVRINDKYGHDKVAYLERIDVQNYRAELKQVVWLDDPKDLLYGGNTQYVVDKKNNYLYIYGNTISNEAKGNQHRITKFKMPKYQGEADFDVRLTADDALESYLMEDYYNLPITPAILQGATIYNDLLFLPTGGGTTRQPSVIYVWNLSQRKMQNVIDLQSLIPYEMEDCAVADGKLYIQAQGEKPLKGVFFCVEFK